MSQITLPMGSFDPFNGVSLDIGEYTPKGVIWFPFSFQWNIDQDKEYSSSNKGSNVFRDYSNSPKLKLNTSREGHVLLLS